MLDLDARVLLRQIADAIEGPVAASVVDDDDFQGHPARGKGLRDDAHGVRNATCLVVRRHHDTQQFSLMRVGHHLQPVCGAIPRFALGPIVV